MSQAPSDSSSARRYILLAIKLSVSIVLLVVLFSRIDVAQLWQTARQASVPWLLAALVVFGISTAVAVWRWNLLLQAQHVDIGFWPLIGSFLVATFFNNFLPSNIGGDVIRISDTGRHANSKTLATTVVLMDRVLGLMALVLVAAVGATAIGRAASRRRADLAGVAVGRLPRRRRGDDAGGVRAGRVRPAAAAADRVSPRMGRRPHLES